MSETNVNPTTPAQPEAKGQPQQAPQPPIDLQELAEKVYALLQKELRIEQERLGRR
jgi:hypothetical protein